MVRVAFASGSGKIASEIIDVLAARQKHEILIISRRDPKTVETRPGVTWAKSDYTDKAQLTGLLKGIETVICFSGAHLDRNSVAQKTLIDAAVAAGVKRYAPNEWSGSSIEELPWYAEKQNIRGYLAEMNKKQKVLEYTLFQPGLLLDMLAPAGALEHIEPMDVFVDFINRRAIVLEDKELLFTFTNVTDIANVVAGAIEYEGKWPVIGGIQGTTMTASELLEIGKKVRGEPFDITYLDEDDVRADKIHSSWLPLFQDPNLPQEVIETFSKVILKGSLLSGISKSWVVSDEWNRLLPDYNFTSAEEFLEKVWAKRD